jgi:hypothetical protein
MRIVLILWLCQLKLTPRNASQPTAELSFIVFGRTSQSAFYQPDLLGRTDMKLSKGQTPLPANKAATHIPMPYSRLILNVVCMAICGWFFLDANIAHAALLSGGLR